MTWSTEVFHDIIPNDENAETAMIDAIAEQIAG